MDVSSVLINPSSVDLPLARALDGRRLLRLFAVLVLGWLPALIGRGAVPEAAALYPLAESAHPYFVPEQALTLYVLAPLVALSATLLFLSPGLMLALALGGGKSLGQWLVSALALSLIVLGIVPQIVQAIVGRPLLDDAFLAVVIACSLASAGILVARTGSGREIAWPLSCEHDGSTLLSMVLAPLALLIVLAPKFYWENFNSDGAHSFEAARLLFFQPLPFWNPAAGELSKWPSMTSLLYAYPHAWYMRIFGEIEVSARLPMLLYVPALYGGLLALIEYGRRQAMTIVERGVLWLGVAIYLVVVAFSATYNQYSADLALPATQDTSLVIFFLGFVLAFVQRDLKWAVLLMVLSVLSLPNGMLLIGFWLAAVAMVWRPRPRRLLVGTGAALVGCVVLVALATPVLIATHLPPPGSKYGLADFLYRFVYLQWANWHRLGFVVIPSGILPVAALVAWRWQPPVARALTLVTVAYFAFFYIQGHSVLHHFIPLMLLPLVVFWTHELVTRSPLRPYLIGGAAAAGLAALLLSMPRDATIMTANRLVGETIEDRIGGYDTMQPAVFKRSEMLAKYLFPYDWDPNVPNESYGGSPLVWNYYMHHPSTNREVNYVFQLSSDPAPAGMRLVASEDDAALYVRSDSVWADHLAIRPPSPAGAFIYNVPRWEIFPGIPQPDGPPIVNMVDVLTRAGFDLDPIFKVLGVSR
jgi:hypothetical protein